MTASWRDRRRRNTIKFRLTDLPCCKRMDSSIHKSRKPFLPPDFRHSNEILKLIKDKQRKLFHINDYDNPTRLKECYVRLCRNLPSCSAEIYVVKEIHGKRSKRKVCFYKNLFTINDHFFCREIDCSAFVRIKSVYWI